MRAIVVTTLLTALVLAACASLREQRQGWLDSARAHALHAPGAPREAQTWVIELTGNLREPNPDNRALVVEGDVLAAIDNAELAARKVPEEAHILLWREAELWDAYRQGDKAEDAFRRALGARPTRDNSDAFMFFLGKKGDLEGVREVCVTAARVLEDNELRRHTERCGQAAHTTTPETAVSWLDAKDQERRATFIAKERAAADAREQQAKVVTACQASCTEMTAACNDKCVDHLRCPKACAENLELCTAKCDGAAADR